MNCLITQMLTYHFAVRVLGIGTLGFALFLLFRKRKGLFNHAMLYQNPWLYLLLALLIWTVVSTLLSDNFSKAFWGERYRFTGLGSYFIFAGVFVCAMMINNDGLSRRLIRIFCSVLAYLSILVIIQVHADTFLNVSLTPDLASVFGQHNHFAYLLCMGIIGFAALFLLDDTTGKLMKTAYLAGEAVLVYTIILNTTFGSYLAALLSLPVLYIFYFRSGREFKFSVLLPVATFLIISIIGYVGLIPAEEPLAERVSLFASEVQDVSTGSDNAIHVGKGRGVLWQQTVQRALERPLFGYGPDGFYGENAIISHDGHTHDSPHNEFLQLAGYTGIPSLIFYLAALILLAIHHWNRLKELDSMVIVASAMVVTYLFSSFFGNPIFYTAPYFWMFLGLIAVTKPVIEADSEPEETTKDQKQLKFGNPLMIILLCVLTTGVVFMYSVWKSGEYISEFADLQAMRNAEITVMAADKRGVLGERNDFWYDAMTYELIPVTEPIPTGYGTGSKAVGEAIDAFNSMYMTEYEYNEKVDYKDKIIKVHAEGTGDDLKVDLEWVTVH